ncbi:acyl-CoA dehydrogenase family protein [Alkalihalobacillus sp. BA299]|uniref:acyl-CoA dehydrogenase family protein n=1 Tax=Alkalihalobacillus sp. BA299 TaxID=2815938 RepID=UPI001ADC1F9C|nr:acyl-CoA dehydrogenase family protein [Alkalihalobacillus sp. BA299]
MKEEILIEDDLRLLQKNIQSFIQNDVVLEEQKVKSSLEKLPENIINKLQTTMKEIGLWFMNAKREWGGAELSIYDQVHLNEIAAQHHRGIYHPGGGAFGSDIPSFLENCTKKQLNNYVIPSIQSGRGCYVAISGKHEGDHPEYLDVQTTSLQNGWLINGHKSYVSNVDQAFFGIVLANVIENGNKKPTLFIIDREDFIQKDHKKLLDVRTLSDIAFNDLFIHKDRIVGKVGEGDTLLQSWVTESQLLLASRCIGVGKLALQLMLEYGQMRITRGQPLTQFPSIRTMIASSATELEAARLLVKQAAKYVATSLDEGSYFAKMAKLYTTEVVFKIVDHGLQIHGGAGFTKDLPFERWYKELRMARVDFMSSEIIHDHIAKTMLDKQS